ncbi:MAG TPA: SprB repeat-containing protein, partial [Cytophagaceae bacterium]
MKKFTISILLQFFGFLSYSQCNNIFIPNGDIQSKGYSNGIRVTSTVDNPLLVEATTENCDGSLRWALYKAITNIGGTYIVFDVNGVIAIEDVLPYITGSGIYLDGTTAPGFDWTTMSPSLSIVPSSNYINTADEISCLQFQGSSNIINSLIFDNFEYTIAGDNSYFEIFNNRFYNTNKNATTQIISWVSKEIESIFPVSGRQTKIYSNIIEGGESQLGEVVAILDLSQTQQPKPPLSVIDYKASIGGIGKENSFYRSGSVGSSFASFKDVQILENKFLNVTNSQKLFNKIYYSGFTGPSIQGNDDISISGIGVPNHEVHLYAPSNNNKDWTITSRGLIGNDGKWTLAKDLNGKDLDLRNGDIYFAISYDKNKVVSSFSLEYSIRKSDLIATTTCKGTPTVLTLKPREAGSRYNWDFNNDGTTDQVTFVPTVEYTYPLTGSLETVVTITGQFAEVKTNAISPTFFPQPTIRATVINQVCPPGNAASTLGSVSLFSNNGTAPYQYFLGTNAPSGESVYGSLSPGSFVANIVDANQCKASQSFEVLDQSPKLKNVCAEYAACDDGGVTRVKFTIERTSPPGNCSFPYTITNEGGFTFSGTALFNTETTVELTNAPPGAFKINLTQDNCNLCSNLSFPFSLGRLSAALSVTDKNKSSLGNSTFAVCGDVVGLTFLFTQSALPCDVSRLSLEKKTYKLEGNAYVLVSTKTTTKLEESLSFGVGKYKVETLALPSKCKIADLEFTVVPNTFEVNVIVRQPVCYNDNGSASLEVSGGTAPYTYRWENPRTVLAIVGPEAKNVMPGGTKVTVTDAKGCIITKSFVLSAVPQMDKPKVEAVSPCYGKASINDMSF